MAAIAQSTPGAIAVNIAVLVGYRLAGATGAIISCIGTVLPPIVIISVVSMFYQAFRDSTIVSAILKGVEAGVAAVIVDLVIDMGQVILKEKNLLLTLLPFFVFIANFIFNINVLFIILTSAILCVIQTYIKSKQGGTFS
ncbi:Chromate transporter [Tetragenococcus halophilus subsp. halophilus]|uniref:Chromate transporter n=2 Tax=Tetragenococcus halophilus TaxID=51669 RepID=A0A2H6CVV9_TETHA|nr:Chromate transporter [Tetragenococcus halophilus subsp. halophilus]